MTHAYRHPIAVAVAVEAARQDAGADTPLMDTGGAAMIPTAFRWRDRAYHVLAVLSSWHLQDKWWERRERQPGRSEQAIDAHGASDRTYFRLRCRAVGDGGDTEAETEADTLLCEIYHDAVSGLWVLERVYD
jgi:hypothetical protein